MAQQEDEVLLVEFNLGQGVEVGGARLLIGPLTRSEAICIDRTYAL